jgi:hypothetical protein
MLQRPDFDSKDIDPDLHKLHKREIMEDPIFKGNQHFHFEMDLDELGRRLYGGEANAAVSFQMGRLRYIPVHGQ